MSKKQFDLKLKSMSQKSASLKILKALRKKIASKKAGGTSIPFFDTIDKGKKGVKVGEKFKTANGTYKKISTTKKPMKIS